MFLSLGSTSVRGLGSDSELGFFWLGFWSRNLDQTETEPRPNILWKNLNSLVKLNSLVLVRGMGSRLELGFFQFGFCSRNLDQTETKPKPNRGRRSRGFQGINLVRATHRPLLESTLPRLLGSIPIKNYQSCSNKKLLIRFNKRLSTHSNKNH